MIAFVGVGPGDPELITLQAVRTLKAAQVVAIADSGTESAVLQIAGHYFEEKEVLRLYLPMSGDLRDWEEAHRAAVRELLLYLDAGKDIAYPVLGDPSFYASSSYLMALIPSRYEKTVVPGVPALCATAAALGVPLAQGRERLTILPGLMEGESLPEGNVVVMKAGQHLAALERLATDRTCFLARNVGMQNEYAGLLSEAPEAYSYFSTVIIKP